MRAGGAARTKDRPCCRRKRERANRGCDTRTKRYLVGPDFAHHFPGSDAGLKRQRIFVTPSHESNMDSSLIVRTAEAKLALANPDFAFLSSERVLDSSIGFW